MPQTPHKDKLIAALVNPKCEASNIDILKQCIIQYDKWIAAVSKVTSTGKARVVELTKLFNDYKDELEVELISKSQSPFLIRQKGQLKLDNSIIEEFLIQLTDKRILDGLPDFPLKSALKRPLCLSHLRLQILPLLVASRRSK